MTYRHTGDAKLNMIQRNLQDSVRRLEAKVRALEERAGVDIERKSETASITAGATHVFSGPPGTVPVITSSSVQTYFYFLLEGTSLTVIPNATTVVTVTFL